MTWRSNRTAVEFVQGEADRYHNPVALVYVTHKHNDTVSMLDHRSEIHWSEIY